MKVKIGDKVKIKWDKPEIEFILVDILLGHKAKLLALKHQDRIQCGNDVIYCEISDLIKVEEAKEGKTMNPLYLKDEAWKHILYLEKIPETQANAEWIKEYVKHLEDENSRLTEKISRVYNAVEDEVKRFG